MISENDFLHLVRDELALPLGENTDGGSDLNRPIHWDSLLMLKLVAAVERRTGNRVSVGKLLRNRNLQSVYDTFAAAA